MKKIIITCLAAFGAFALTAQQDAMFTHYMYNTLGVNPGYAGSRDALTATLLHRNQWASFDGAPKTNTLTLHTPLFNDKVGVGFSFINDNVGPIKNNSINIDLAYRLPVNDKATLAFGLKGGANIMSGDLIELDLDEDQDNAFGQNIGSEFLPNFGFGLYYYTDKFYIGASAPKLLENDFETMQGVNTPGAAASQARHYFFIAGTVFDLTQSIKLKPTTFLKVTEAAPVELDLTGTLIFNDKFNAGLMWRSNDALGVLLGLNVTEQLMFGYSFDWSYRSDWNSVEKTIQRTSHEVMLRYDLIFKGEEKIRSPRYF